MFLLLSCASDFLYYKKYDIIKFLIWHYHKSIHYEKNV